MRRTIRQAVLAMGAVAALMGTPAQAGAPDGKWQVKAPGVPKNPAVTNVRLGKDGDKTRIVIDLAGKVQPKFTLSKDGYTLDIRLDH